MITLTPRQAHTGKYFEATLEVTSENGDAVVIHGWLNHQGSWILHAWCEIGEQVIDLTETREGIAKSSYYQVMGVTPERFIRYERYDFFCIGRREWAFWAVRPSAFFCRNIISGSSGAPDQER